MVKGFSVVNESDVFLHFPCFFYDLMWSECCSVVSDSAIPWTIHSMEFSRGLSLFQGIFPTQDCRQIFFFFIFWLLRFFYFNFILFLNFTILYWFCHISKWIRHRHTCVLHPEPSSLLHPHTISLGHPSAPAPSIQYRASNLDWRLVSYMLLYIFQCHSPKSSHPLPLPQSPKDCSIHAGRFFTRWATREALWSNGCWQFDLWFLCFS